MDSVKSRHDISYLLDRCRRKDSRAWTELVDMYQAMVYSIARRHGLDRDDANDVFVVTFQTLLKNLDRIESPAALPKWIGVTASRECLRVLRVSGRSTGYEVAGITLDELVAHEDELADQSAIKAEQAHHLRSVLHKISEKCRKLLKMLYFDEESSYTEISEKLGMPIGAIGPTRGRCLESLRTTLRSEGFFD